MFGRMNARTGFKIAILIITAAVAVTLFVAVPRLMRSDGDELVRIPEPGSIEGETLDKEAATKLFPVLDPKRRTRGEIYDPLTIVSLGADRFGEREWAEHPTGRMVYRTNNLGFREDEPTVVKKPAGTFRVLVAGDSHTEGFVHNPETFANVLEHKLNERGDGTRYEVINGGIGTTGPYSHLGVLRKHLDLEPDLFLATLYTGNDFVDAMKISDFYSKRKPGPFPPEAKQRMNGAAKRWPRQLSQGFFQAHLFHHRPWDAKVGKGAAERCYKKMRELCRDNGIGFACLILPTKMQVDLEDDRDTFDAIVAALELSDEVIDLNRDLAIDFREAMRKLGSPCVDPFDAMRADPRPLYWRGDYHLNVDGHALVADLLLEELGDQLGTPGG